jgi:hypothetical protein
MKLTTYAANQYVINVEDRVIFQSYQTIVAILQDGKVSITEGQPQSKTTAKWLNRFLQDYTKFKSYKEVN